MQIKLILLDFDGTLAATIDAHTKAYISALQDAGYTLDEAEYKTKFFGVCCSEFLRALGIGDADEIDRIRRRKIELYPTFFDSIRLNEPLWNFAQAFRAQGGKVWIVSTGQKENIHNAMQHLGIEGNIDGIITSDDVVESKPSPEAFLKAMAAEGVLPEETLIFEDSAVGLKAAQASGAAYFKVKL